MANLLMQKLGVDLTKIPGIDASNALTILAEIGTDMSCWKSEKHFVSWLGLCPDNKISGGRRLSGRTKPSANRAARALKMAAFSLHRSKSALGAFLRRLKFRIGSPKAITAVARKLACLLYRMLNKGTEYVEQGQDYYDQKYKERKLKCIQKQAEELGFDLVMRTAS